MSNIITMCPSSFATQIHINQRKTQKGIYYKVQYYVDFNCKSINGYFTDEQLNQILQDIEKEKNTKTTILQIKTEDITENITKYFRIIEPFIEYPEQEAKIDPYILGLWLGDGHSHTVSLTNIDIPIIDAWKAYAQKMGYDVSMSKEKPRKGEIQAYETSFVASYNIMNGPIRQIFRSYDLLNNKHIPNCYLENSKEVRVQLLAGIIDTDGSLNKCSYEIIQKNKILSEDIVTLARSLGFYTRINETKKSCIYKGEKREGVYYRIHLNLNQFTPELPLLCERKQWRYNENIGIFNPMINMDGERKKQSTQWTEEMKITLYSIVTKIKQAVPESNVTWKNISKISPLLANISADAMDTMYRKTLLPQKSFYDDKIIDVDIDFLLLADDKWRENYYQIEKILKSGKRLRAEDNKYLYAWFKQQRHIKHPVLVQKIDELWDLQEANKDLYSDEVKTVLYSIVTKIKSEVTDCKMMWKNVNKLHPSLTGIQPDELKSIYTKTLLPQKSVYDNKIIDIYIDYLLLAEDKWRQNFLEVETILKSGAVLRECDNKYLYAWFNQQKYIKHNMLLQKINELWELQKNNNYVSII